MTDNELFPLGSFAKFARVTRDALHHYDKIGLLLPESQGENNSRYYSCGQLTVVNLIRTLKGFGLSLSEIKTLKDQRTPEHVNEMFARQIEEIRKNIKNWRRAEKLLSTLQESINSALMIDEDAITIQFMRKKAVIIGDVNDYSSGKNDYDALLDFYKSMSKKYPDLDLNYPVWGVFSEERIKQGDWVLPDRYYFYNPEGHDIIPATLYAVGYTRCGYGKGRELYKRLIDYINKSGFEICGDAYEEYPLNEISVSDDTNYLMRVMIPVCEKK